MNKKIRWTLLGTLVVAITITVNGQTTIKRKINAQKQSDYSSPIQNISGRALQLIHQHNKGPLSEEDKAKFLIYERGQQELVGAIIKTRDVSPSMLTQYGVQIGTTVGDIVTVQIPLNKLQQVVNLEGIDYLSINTPVRTKLDSALMGTGVYSVHTGVDLSSEYLGDGVIIGVLDQGFDYTHPTFFDTSESHLRVTRVWDMSDNMGSAPSGYAYGSEYVGESDILNQQYSAEGSSHGTHVASIAGGAGFAPDGAYSGVAPNAELVFVHVNGGATDVIDGVNYVFDYAQSQGKPAVINMSLGSHLGPHDGSSLRDLALDGLAGTGKIIVGAAGNEGDTPLHASHQFNSDTIQTTVYFEDYGDNAGSGSVDVWGSANSDLKFSVNIYDAQGGLVDWLPYLETVSEDWVDTLLVLGADTVEIIAESESAHVTNNRPHIQFDLYNSSTDYYIAIELIGDTNEVHIWNDGQGGGAPLSHLLGGTGTTEPGWVNGDTEHTVGEIGGTAHSVISVGAYTTKNSFENFDGQTVQIPFFEDLEEIAPFSSLGPTIDGRTKPDVSAPGNVVVAALNSFDTNYQPGGDSWEDVVDGITDGTDTWYVGAQNGTSMASPIVSGIIALWLQVDSTLDPLDVKQLIQDQSRNDAYTGATPNTTWGWGKIDAHQGIKQLQPSTDVVEVKDEKSVIAYPNPSSGVFSVDFSTIEGGTMEVFDITGTMLVQQQIDGQHNVLDLTNLSEGAYFLQVSNGTQVIEVLRLNIVH